jgi:hypothetical protein
MALGNRRAALIWLTLVCICVCVFDCACCGVKSVEVRNEDRAAQEWIRDWPGKYDWEKFSSWSDVSQSNNSAAQSLLHEKSWVQVTEAQAAVLTGAGPSSKREAPFLLRAVGSPETKLPLEVFARADGSVWVGGEAISRCNVPLQRRAIVIWLSHPPREVYVTFDVAR